MAHTASLSWVFTAWAFALGACLGSFYGVCIDRYVHAIPLRGRSFCFGCKRTLRPLHLVPLASWLFLKGRCAFCGSPIGFAAFFVECVSGLAAAALAARYGFGPAFFAALLFFGVLIVLSGIDAACYILPDALVLPLIPAGFLIAVWGLGMPWGESLAGGLAGAALLLGLRQFFFMTRGVEALGLGDVKLMVSLGFVCGLTALPVLLLAASLSGLAAMACRFIKASGRLSLRRERIPFGPFLAFGCFVAVLWGEKILLRGSILETL